MVGSEIQDQTFDDANPMYRSIGTLVLIIRCKPHILNIIMKRRIQQRRSLIVEQLKYVYTVRINQEFHRKNHNNDSSLFPETVNIRTK